MEEIKNRNGQRLHASIKAHCGKEAADAILEKLPISMQPSPARMLGWIREMDELLERDIGPDLVEPIRAGCACGPSPNRINAIKKVYDASMGAEDFCRKMNNKQKGFSLELDEDGYLYSYPTCYCSAVKHLDEQVPRSWCLCTVGYTKRLFEGVLGEEVEVELLESVKTGGERCLMKVVPV